MGRKQMTTQVLIVIALILIILFLLGVQVNLDA
jgi:uncharacterized integral membrane protein